MTPRNAVVASLFALAACPHPAPLPTPPTAPPEQDVLRPRVKTLSSEAEQLLARQDEMLWKHWTEGAPLDIPKSYEGHEGLFTPESIRDISRLRALTHDAREARQLAHLWSHFVGEYLAKALSEQTEAIAALEASVAFSAAGHDYPYRNLEHLLAGEKSAPERRALYAGASAAVERISPLVRVRQERAERLLKDLGLLSYDAYGAALREVDLVEMAALAEQVLQATQAPYEQVMEQLAQRELKTPLAKLRRCDLPRLFRAGGADKDFPKEREVPRVLDTLSGMGIDVRALPNLKIDDTESSRKNPRPLALALRLPEDVRVSVRPTGGVRAQATFLREVGHALHFAFAKETAFELLRLGDGATYAADALLFEDLLGDPVWLQELTALSGDRLSDYLASASAFKLYHLRLEAAHVLYEVQLHRADPGEAKGLYAGIFGRALGLPLDADEQARFIVDQEDFYGSVDGLRAGFLAGQLQAQLKARFGPSWWHQADAGGYLKALWAPANALTAQEWAQRLGDPGIRPDGLLLRLGALLKVQMTLSTGPLLPIPGGDAGVPDAGPRADAGGQATTRAE